MHGFAGLVIDAPDADVARTPLLLRERLQAMAERAQTSRLVMAPRTVENDTVAAGQRAQDSARRGAIPAGVARPGQSADCGRGLLEVEAESVAYMVTQAHGLDSAQYSFNYVAGWAGEAAQAGVSVADVVATTGARVIGTVDQILRRTQPDDLEARIVDAHADSLGISQDTPSAPTPSWDTVKPVPAICRYDAE